LVIESTDSGDNLMLQFARTVMSLKKGDDKKLAEAVPPIETIESRLKLQPKTLVIEGGSYDSRQLANNHLERVSFTGTKLLPKGIWKLEFLKELHLTKCDLTEFPDRLGKLSQSLAILNLSNNKIRKVDPCLITFRNLKHLNLSCNEIRVIPLELVFIKSLLHLDISRNQVQKVPFTIGLMKSLKQLNLSHNRLDHFPESIIRPLTNTAKMLLRMDNFDLSGNDVSEAQLQSGPGRSFLRSESLQRLRDQQQQADQQIGDRTLSPPSLFEISARSVLKCTKAYRVLHCWLPRTVYDYLQENAALCSKCTAACVAYRSELVPGPGHFSMLTNTMQSDASTSRIPIVRFICWHCDLKAQANSHT
jgi:hypothetical protein